MKKFKFLFFCVLYLNILGCQSCSKDPQPDPNHQPIFFNVSAIADGGIILIPLGTAKMEKGTVASFNISSGPNKKFQVKKNGVSDLEYHSGNYVYKTIISSDTYIEVVSKATTFTVTASAGTGGTVTPDTTIVEYGKDLILNPIEDPGYTLTSIKVNGVSVPVVKPYTQKNVTANTDVKFEFTLTQILILTNGADNKSRPWKLKSWEFYDINHVYEYQTVLNTDQLTDKHYYYSNGNGESITAAGIIRPWSWAIIPGNIFTSGTMTYSIIELTDTKFAFEYKANFTAGRTDYKRITYVRQ